MSWAKGFAVGILFLFSLNVAALSEPPVQSAGNAQAQQQPQSSQDKAKFPSDIQTTKITPSAEEKLPPSVVPNPPENKGDQQHWQSSPEWWLVILTGGLVLVTGALAFFTAYLYNATVNLGREAKESGEAQSAKMEASIAQAERAANAAETSANATKYLAEADRAWMVNNQINSNLELQGMTQGHISVVIVWINAGRSPAINVSFDAQYRFVGRGDPIPHFIADHNSAEGRCSTGQGVQNSAGELKVDAARMQDLLSGNWRLIVYSSVQYQTLFTELGFRHTQICTELTPRHSPPRTEWANNFVGKQNSVD